MKNILIPNDIRSYVRKKVILRTLFFVGLEALAALINIFLFDPLSSVLDGWKHILLIISIQSVPFVVSKFPLNIIGKSWCGEVIAVDIKTRNDAFFAGGKTQSYTNHQIMLSIKKENGKVITVKAKEVGEPNPETIGLLGYVVPNQGNIKDFLDYYSVGDKVYHFYMLPNDYIAKKIQIRIPV